MNTKENIRILDIQSDMRTFTWSILALYLGVSAAIAAPEPEPKICPDICIEDVTTVYGTPTTSLICGCAAETATFRA